MPEAPQVTTPDNVPETGIPMSVTRGTRNININFIIRDEMYGGTPEPLDSLDQKYLDDQK